jgi:hypothetical protein
MKYGPKHIFDAEDLEPLYSPQVNILEECLRREAERVAHQENLMNRVVYDCVDAAPTVSNNHNHEENAEIANEPATKITDDTNAEDPNQCDNDQIFTPYY